MGVEMDQLLDGLSPHSNAVVNWGQPSTRFKISSYLTTREPPSELVTCAHGVVIHTNLVIIMRRVDGSHYLPGGPIREGESYRETLDREVYDKCALSIVQADYLGFVHFTHGGQEGGPSDAHPDMFHVVYYIAASGSPFLGDVERFQEEPRMARPAQAAAMAGAAYALPFIEYATRGYPTRGFTL